MVGLSCKLLVISKPEELVRLDAVLKKQVEKEAETTIGLLSDGGGVQFFLSRVLNNNFASVFTIPNMESGSRGSCFSEGESRPMKQLPYNHIKKSI